MTPNEPIDEYHRISLALTQRIREWYNAMQAEVARWTLGTYNKEKKP